MVTPTWAARDSLLWWLLFYGGMVLGLALGVINLDPLGPAGYGIPPLLFKWAILINLVITGFAGKNGMSNVELKRNLPGEDSK